MTDDAATSDTSGDCLPTGAAPAAVSVDHFPDRTHAFVLRNWQAVEPQRLARILGTSVAKVKAIASSMGLPAVQPFEDRERGDLTVLRRNWHLLPYEQLLELLDLSAEQLAHKLREDDFLWHKLGHLKPDCKPLRYVEPDASSRQRAAQIAAIVDRHFGDAIRRPIEPRFRFIERLSAAPPPPARSAAETEAHGQMRYIYAYFALFGDPLLTPQIDPYPDGLLQRLSQVGVNGVWMHIVLRDMAPGGAAFPEFGAAHQTRLGNLNRLAERAGRHGIGIYLYINEPRAMPVAFFRDRQHLAGIRDEDHISMCTSHPQVRSWLGDAMAYIFEQVPQLAGVFTITASENQTSCASHGRREQCPRCRDRTDAEVIAEVNNVIEEGVHRSKPDARVIAWDWGWTGDVQATIDRLNRSIYLMSVSEWTLPIERGGVKSEVGEYAMSAVGPGPRATAHWAWARERGLATMAKVQLNITWEMAAVPYLPVMDLVAEHCHRLAAAGIDGMMLSWSLGGYPSPNLEIANRFRHRPAPSVAEVLDALAEQRYGRDGAADARRAWTAFSDAFVEYPYHINVVYFSPVEVGPANLLFAKPTGYKATMTGFPYDDVDGWRGPYPPEVFANQFEKLAAGWQRGMGLLAAAVERAPAEQRDGAQDELLFAQAAGLHFRSVANQMRFVMMRDHLAAGVSADTRSEGLGQIRSILEDEIEAACQLHALAAKHSCVGFEAANQYFYLPIDLIEKVINCEHLLSTLQ